jgi:site-specific recombinase XerD
VALLAGDVRLPEWIKEAIDTRTRTANIRSGKLFRCVNKTGSIWGQGITEKVVWCMVRECASKAKIERLTPHDLRRIGSRLCYESGGELEQIQSLLEHVSVQTTERYLGCKQRLREPVNDKLELESVRSSRMMDSSQAMFSGRPVMPELLCKNFFK